MIVYSKRVQTKIIRKWYLFDATNRILGRLSTELVYFLCGKHKINYLPYLDHGDYCVVVNARKVCVTGRKSIDKKYYHHTGYPGGIKMSSFSDMLRMFPERIIEIAVKGMLPKGSLGRAIYRKLKVYPDCIHPHVAQQPIVLKHDDL